MDFGIRTARHRVNISEPDHGQRRFNTIASRTPALDSCSSMIGVAAFAL